MTFRYCNSLRSFPAAMLVLAGLVLLSLTLVSCQQVTDPTTTLSIDKSDVGKCIKDCNLAAQALTKAESDLHKINIFLCRKDQGCQKAENQRHQDAIARIEAQRLACIQECHHQGGASGGR